MIKIFLDASMIFSAMKSQSGGSFRIVGLAREKKIIALTTETVINELKANTYKLKSNATSVDSFIAKNKIMVCEEVGQNEIEPFENLIETKDAHVVVGALSTECNYLITLDKKHLDNPQTKKNFKKLRIVSPREFLQKVFRSQKKRTATVRRPRASHSVREDI